MRVAQVEPGEASEEPAAYPFDEDPARRESDEVFEVGVFGVEAIEEAALNCREEGKGCGEEESEYSSEPGSCAAVGVDADEDPGDACGKEAEAEEETECEGAFGCGVLECEEEQCRTEDAKWVVFPGGKGEREEGAA